MKNTHILLIIATLLLSSCKIADMRTNSIKDNGISTEAYNKGKKILDETWYKHGFNKFSEHKTYSFNGSDTWKGLMGKMGKPWPEAKSNMNFKYEVGSFDSQVTYLDGKREGITAGLQSWNYYEMVSPREIDQLKMNKKVRFGLSAYHYFFEMLDRLKDVPIIQYGGEITFNGNDYNIVFATWNKVEPHKENDQYKLLINKKTGLLDYAIYSLRENYLKFPGSGSFYGSIKYDDYKEVDGILIPHKQTVFLNSPKENIKKHAHQLIVTDFKFDGFDSSLLKPLSDINPTGDSKIKG
ncbi:hypothetical protein [uncultured Algibacter sp.]|uniref:hypothetical protein n=1 Tax=uncultured Algibacter sp. TaxID=298659 RepID=UPI00261AB336|nr:hypothetical protein [uncultured Algibacter sp.]